MKLQTKLITNDVTVTRQIELRSKFTMLMKTLYPKDSWAVRSKKALAQYGISFFVREDDFIFEIPRDMTIVDERKYLMFVLKHWR